jgi:hypothetical protein
MSGLTLLLDVTVLMLFFGLCHAIGASLVAPQQSRLGLGIAILSFVTGMCVVSFLFLLTKVVGSVLVVMVVAIPAMALLYRYRKPALVIRCEYRAAHIGSALALVVVAALPIVIMGARMGTGNFPEVFFAVDSPHFLQHVYSLMRTHTYPPPSFEIADFSYKYHYGIQAFVALASTLTGLKPHLVMFLVLIPVLEIVSGLLTYDICRRLTRTHGQAILALALVLFGAKQYLRFDPDPSLLEFLTRPENYNFRYSHPPSSIGFLMSLGIVRALMDFEDRDARWTAILLVALMPLFKIPYVVSIGAGLALVYLYELRKHFYPERLLEVVAAGALSLGCLAMFAVNRAASGSSIRIDMFGFTSLMSDGHKQTMMVFGAVTVLTALWKRVGPQSDEMTRLGLFATSCFLLFSGLGLHNPSLADQSLHLVFDVVVLLGVVAMSTYVVGAWFDSASRSVLTRAVAIAVCLGLIGPGVISNLNHTYIVSVEPERGHEYVDNGAVADALMHIPLDGTLLATNDLRYPANNYRRDNRQFQLAGVFGHRNMASNLGYAAGVSEEPLESYETANQLFQQEDWPAVEIRRLRGQMPVTHLLIRKTYTHATNIPLRIVYQNQEYAVYVF